MDGHIVAAQDFGLPIRVQHSLAETGNEQKETKVTKEGGS